MQSIKARAVPSQTRSNKLLILVVVFVVLGAIGLVSYLAFNQTKLQSPPQAAQVVSVGKLGEQYGLGVNLIAVTAVGGMVDLRLEIIDAEKAKTFLEDKANFPKLQVEDNVLQISEDIASQPIEFENGKSIFVLYPNAQNAVKPGDLVTILFGDIQTEAIQSK